MRTSEYKRKQSRKDDKSSGWEVGFRTFLISFSTSPRSNWFEFPSSIHIYLFHFLGKQRDEGGINNLRTPHAGRSEAFDCMMLQFWHAPISKCFSTSGVSIFRPAAGNSPDHQPLRGKHLYNEWSLLKRSQYNVKFSFIHPLRMFQRLPF